jgi:hypothetical protein
MSDLDWVRELQAELWPEEQRKKGGGQTRHGWVQIKLEAKRRLKKKEWQRVCKAIVEHKLIVSMFSTNMFGGVGISINEHPAYPGLPTEHLLTLTQEHLPGKLGKKGSEPTHGACLREAWEVFSEFTHTEQNKAWLKQYGFRQPGSPSSYDY